MRLQDQQSGIQTLAQSCKESFPRKFTLRLFKAFRLVEKF